MKQGRSLCPMSRNFPFLSESFKRSIALLEQKGIGNIIANNPRITLENLRIFDAKTKSTFNHTWLKIETHYPPSALNSSCFTEQSSVN